MNLSEALLEKPKSYKKITAKMVNQAVQMILNYDYMKVFIVSRSFYKVMTPAAKKVFKKNKIKIVVDRKSPTRIFGYKPTKDYSLKFGYIWPAQKTNQ